VSGAADRLSSLTPEQRALVARKLAERQLQSSRTAQARGTPAKEDLRAMKSFACRMTVPGNFERLTFEQLEVVPPGPGQIQIKARAFSLNFRDLMIAIGMYPPTPGIPSIMGSDYSGEVVACGDGVDEFQPGDAVIALSAGNFTPENEIIPNCHFASTSNISAWQAVPKPANLGFPEAAAIPTVFLTSYYALHGVARLQPGERVLIHSATGGVGLAAIQVARWLGGEIFATAGSQSKREFLATIGIAGAMDSRSTDFAREIMERTNGEGMDVILNTLSGEAVLKGLEILRPFGRFVQIDKKDIAVNEPMATGVFKNGLSFTAVDLALFLRQPRVLNRQFREVSEHFQQERFQPLPHRSFPIEKLAEALSCMSQFKHIGKITLTYD
jgi:NADPH:quinone reductase-like Zn-dependent oxidoreductase